MAEFLHERRDFDQLLAVVANERALDPMLVEKDYWIMHSLWGLQAQGFVFELKGGTSLSKGFGIIHRFVGAVHDSQLSGCQIQLQSEAVRGVRLRAQSGCTHLSKAAIRFLPQR